jgi:hypothetical protein
MSNARVRSVDALVDLKAAFCTFTAEAKEALSSLELEIRHFEDWLACQLTFWKHAVKQCEEDVFLAKQELSQRKMMRFHDREPDTTEQEKALRLAKERLEYAEEKVEKTKRWLQQYPDAIIEYKGPTNQLTTILEADLPKADALLQSKIAALEAYMQIAAPASENKDVRS